MSTFKPGEWVDIPSLNTEPVQYRSDLCHLGLELWKPQPGEWCWFWGIFDLVPKLAQFIDVHSKGYHAKTFSANDSSYYSNVEPFIGQLPTILKDNI